MPAQISKQKYDNISTATPLIRFLAKTVRVNKIAMKKLLKNLSFGVGVKLYVPPLMYKINALNICMCCENVGYNPD